MIFINCFFRFLFQIQMSQEANIIAEPIIKKDKRGRKPKYATAEERHQREYRKRKRLLLESMQNQINELTTLLHQANTNK